MSNIIDFNKTYEYKIKNLHLVKKTQIEMILDRGYNVTKSELEILLMSDEDFLEAYSDIENWSNWNHILKPLGRGAIGYMSVFKQQRAMLSEIYYNDDEQACIVFYLDSPDESGSIGVKVAQGIEILVDKNKDIQDVILISASRFSSDAIDRLRLFKNSPRINSIWTFEDRELIINPTKHSLYQEHTLLSKSDSSRFFKIYRYPPQISEEDPIVKYFGWKVGRIVQITRSLDNIDIGIDKMIEKRIIVRSTRLVDAAQSTLIKK
jgi:DNA-directed RNA polymerase subunit H (RpoH/RPB5)